VLGKRRDEKILGDAAIEGVSLLRTKAECWKSPVFTTKTCEKGNEVKREEVSLWPFINNFYFSA
jgi:hypothetical protein